MILIVLDRHFMVEILSEKKEKKQIKNFEEITLC